jgi:hypothetical protein
VLLVPLRRKSFRAPPKTSYPLISQPEWFADTHLTDYFQLSLGRRCRRFKSCRPTIDLRFFSSPAHPNLASGHNFFGVWSQIWSKLRSSGDPPLPAAIISGTIQMPRDPLPSCLTRTCQVDWRYIATFNLSKGVAEAGQATGRPNTKARFQSSRCQ